MIISTINEDYKMGWYKETYKDKLHKALFYAICSLMYIFNQA